MVEFIDQLEVASIELHDVESRDRQTFLKHEFGRHDVFFFFFFAVTYVLLKEKFMTTYLRRME